MNYSVLQVNDVTSLSPLHTHTLTDCVQGCALCTGELNSECLQCQEEGLYRDTSNLLSLPCVAECTNGTFPENNTFGVQLCQGGTVTACML